jgi:iron(III) transport system ATP-binding protein
VVVLLRPEALRVAPVSDTPATPERSHVVAARLLGRYSLLHLCVHDAQGGELHLHAHVHGVLLPEPGQVVELALDPSQVFVFPADADASAP